MRQKNLDMNDIVISNKQNGDVIAKDKFTSHLNVQTREQTDRM